MRHFIFSALGTSGDIHPLLGIAAALQRAGHEVTFIANPAFEAPVRELGLAFAPVGTEAEYRRLARSPQMWSWPGGVRLAFRDGWIPNTAPVYRQIASLYRARSTVLVATPIAVGARLAAERLDLPLVTLLPTPLYLRSTWDTPRPGPIALPKSAPAKRLWFRLTDLFVEIHLTPTVNRFRRELGLPPVRRLFNGWILSPQRVVGLWPDWFASSQPDWPPQVYLAGFVRYDRSNLSSGLPISDPEPPPDPRTIVMTAGSAVSHAKHFLEVAVAAAGQTGRPFVVTGIPESHRG
ncbi:MAG: glycosyltransferase, partial [Chloroflexi bacterium]|nr:glycosyltransferase [Chloroflexota bacterium]